MSDPLRWRILEACRDRLAAIRLDAGFRTDVGTTLFVGQIPELGDGDPHEAIAVVLSEDEPAWVNQTGGLVRGAIQVHALAKDDGGEWRPVELALADIKQAIELDDRDLGGLLTGNLARGATALFARTPGSSTIGLTISYQAQWKEPWGGA